jgi:3-deoxy-manno-octulosonate cytidylyltransferase (CMP-KDO synthetase)
MDIQSCVTLMEDSNVSIGTAVAEIHPGEDKTAASIVKMIGTQFEPGRFRALYFTRALCPWGEGPHYQHIGIYAWRRTVLGQFVNLPPSTLETREKLEQLRALEAGMRIDAALVPEVPLSVDTPADLEHARTTMRS